MCAWQLGVLTSEVISDWCPIVGVISMPILLCGFTQMIYISVHNTCTLLSHKEKYVDANLDASETYEAYNIEYHKCSRNLMSAKQNPVL